MRTYKYNWGKFLFLRVCLVGWTLQTVHALDRTERLLRIALELCAVCLMVLLLSNVLGSLSGLVILASAIVVHIMFLVCNSGWLAGMRECFPCIKNLGVERTIDFLGFTRSIVAKSAAANAILVYGSLSRRVFHERSDVDLRIIRRKGVLAALKLFFLCILLRFWGMYKFGVLLDLKMVDTMEFLHKEMRRDERPLVVMCAPEFTVPTPGDTYETLKRDPEAFLRK